MYNYYALVLYNLMYMYLSLNIFIIELYWIAVLPVEYIRPLPRSLLPNPPLACVPILPPNALCALVSIIVIIVTMLVPKVSES